MNNYSYKKKLKAVFLKLNMISPKIYHFGRYVASAVLDMKEADPMMARAIMNWPTDTFGEDHSKKL